MRSDFPPVTPVTYETAKRRVLRLFRKDDRLHQPAQIASAIWPGHDMKPQGAGFAAAGILRKMEKEGLVRLHWPRYEGNTVGYQLTDWLPSELRRELKR